MQILERLTMILEANSEVILVAVAILIATVVVFQIVKNLIYQALRKYDEYELVDALADRIEEIGWFTALITAFYLIVSYLPATTEMLETIAYVAFILIWVWQLVKLAGRAIDFAVDRVITRNEGENAGMYRFLARTFKVLLWILAALMILSNLGYDVNSLIAGLGIGGVAVALAVQALLGDFISSFSLIADKPIKVGEFIVLGELMGTVEKIGIKSTRLRSINGELIIVPNSTLVSSNIQNYGEVEKRRSLSTIGVTYETDAQALKDIPAMIISILEGNNFVEKDSYRINLVAFADFSINYELQFFTLTGDYNEFLKIQEDVFLQIKEKFDAEGIEFAYPTQTIYMSKQG